MQNTLIALFLLLVFLSSKPASGYRQSIEAISHGQSEQFPDDRYLLIKSCRPTVIVGLFLQQVIALFVLKSGAGFSIFKWIATLASDFLGQSQAGAVFFFDQETYAKHWFFVGTVSLWLSCLNVVSDVSYSLLRSSSSLRLSK